MEKTNKLIAEFMGYEVKHGKCYSPKYNDGTIAPMQFDKSWDWLMPVIENIESLGYEVQIRNTDCIIFQLLDTIKYKPIVDISSRNGKKDSTYKAVVEFIKNQNN